MNALTSPGHAMNTLRCGLTGRALWSAPTQEEITPLLCSYMDELDEYGASTTGSYPFLSTFWYHPTRLALGIGHQTLQGFVLLLEDQDPKDGQTRIEIREFYIRRRYRRAGMGRHAVRSLLARWPGDWQLAVLNDNSIALKFWHSALSERSVSISVTTTHHYLSIEGNEAR